MVPYLLFTCLILQTDLRELGTWCELLGAPSRYPSLRFTNDKLVQFRAATNVEDLFTAVFRGRVIVCDTESVGLSIIGFSDHKNM